ncbi:hypothetical protein GCM10022630_16040 [Thermobifida alba]
MYNQTVHPTQTVSVTTIAVTKTNQDTKPYLGGFPYSGGPARDGILGPLCLRLSSTATLRPRPRSPQGIRLVRPEGFTGRPGAPET